jgi:hypothetical protein
LTLSFQVGKGLKNNSNCEASIPIDTDYVELSLEGLDEAKETINSIGALISSSCIPSLSSAGLVGSNLLYTSVLFFRRGRLEKNFDWEKKQYFLNHKVLCLLLVVLSMMRFIFAEIFLEASRQVPVCHRLLAR